MESIRNPTDNEIMRAARGYFTGRAADFRRAIDKKQYQAAVFAKDRMDAVYGFLERYMDEEDKRLVYGDENTPPLIPMTAEADARAAVDAELIQDEVFRRYLNLIRRLKGTIYRGQGSEGVMNELEAEEKRYTKLRDMKRRP